jgi:hypothetical protein
MKRLTPPPAFGGRPPAARAAGRCEVLRRLGSGVGLLDDMDLNGIKMRDVMDIKNDMDLNSSS